MIANYQLEVLYVIEKPKHVTQVIAEQKKQLPPKLCRIVKLSINVVDVQNANQIGIHEIVQNHVPIP